MDFPPLVHGFLKEPLFIFIYPASTAPFLEQLLPLASFFLCGASGKELACQCGRDKRHRFNPWVEKTPWTRKWQPTSVFLPGESHKQRTLAGYSPWGRKEPDTTEHTRGPTGKIFLEGDPVTPLLNLFSFFNFQYFIWLHRISLQQAGSISLTRDRTWAPCTGCGES